MCYKKIIDNIWRESCQHEFLFCSPSHPHWEIGSKHQKVHICAVLQRVKRICFFSMKTKIVLGLSLSNEMQSSHDMNFHALKRHHKTKNSLRFWMIQHSCKHTKQENLQSRTRTKFFLFQSQLTFQ